MSKPSGSASRLEDERVMMSMKAKLIGKSNSLDQWIKQSWNKANESPKSKNAHLSLWERMRSWNQTGSRFHEVQAVQPSWLSQRSRQKKLLNHLGHHLGQLDLREILRVTCLGKLRRLQVRHSVKHCVESVVHSMPQIDVMFCCLCCYDVKAVQRPSKY